MAICACLMAAIAVPVAALPPSAEGDVTVVVNFKGPSSAAAVKEMEREAGGILHSSGIQLDWRARSDVGDIAFKDLVLMTFHGSCMFTPMPPRYDELGPYAITHSTGGEVLPFGEVDCDHVAGSIRNAMTGGDYAKADVLLGRALGRVVAHELVHMLTKSAQHGKEGVEKAALTGRQLIADSLPLSEFDIDRLQMERKPRQ
jgi:hypothetical protein